MGALQPWHIIVILAVLVVLFGSKKLPGAARSMGQSMRIFKAETKGMMRDDESDQQHPAGGQQQAQQLPPGQQQNAQQQPAQEQATVNGVPLVAPQQPTDQTQR